MNLTILPGTTIRFTIRPVDADAAYIPLEPGTAPIAGGISIRKNGTTLTGSGTDYSVTIGSWNNGYLVTITLVVAAVAGDHFAVQATYTHSAVTYYWHLFGTCEHSTSSTLTHAQFLAYIQLLTCNDAATAAANAAQLALINGAGGAFSSLLHSLKAILERGNAAWVSSSVVITNPVITVQRGDECRTVLTGRTDTPVNHILLAYESDGETELSLEGKSLTFIIKTNDDATTIATVANGSITKSGNSATVPVPRLGLTPDDAGQYSFSLNDSATGEEYASGEYWIQYAPQPVA